MTISVSAEKLELKSEEEQREESKRKEKCAIVLN